MGQRRRSISRGSSGGDWRCGDLCRRQAVGDEQRERAQSVLRHGDSGYRDRGRLGIRGGIFFGQERKGRQSVDFLWQGDEGHEKTARRNVEVCKSHESARPVGICCCVEASLSVATSPGVPNPALLVASDAPPVGSSRYLWRRADDTEATAPTSASQSEAA